MTERLHSRPFEWNDIDGLHRLMRTAPAGIVPHIGDFYWGLRGTPDDDLLRDTRAWTDGDALAAVAWLDPPNSNDAIIAPDADEGVLYGVLDWLEAAHQARSSEPLAIVAQHGDTMRLNALQRRGYVRTAEGNLRFRRPLAAMPEVAPLVAGFSLRHVATDDDVRQRAFVESSSFGGSVSAERWRRLAQRMPNYLPTLDLLVVAADGTGASACTCWYDAETRRGEVEAMGTAVPYRRLGLGKAVVTEGLRRLREMGATEAILYTNIGNVASAALYRLCGFDATGEDFAWEKRL